MLPPAWQKHHHMGSAAIDPYGKQRKGLTIEGMRWISYGDFTTHPVKMWGFSLGLILRTRLVDRGQTRRRSGYEPANRRDESWRFPHWKDVLLFPQETWFSPDSLQVTALCTACGQGGLSIRSLPAGWMCRFPHGNRHCSPGD